MTLRLDQLPHRRPATVTAVAWDSLSETDQRRLRHLGLDEGVEVETLHAGPIGRDPLAVRFGRTHVALRRAHARVVTVSEDGAGA